jgi:hypothetical protein
MKISLHTNHTSNQIMLVPSGFREDWSAICSLKFAVDKGPPNILSYITLDMKLILALRSQKALCMTCGPIEHVIVRRPGSPFLVMNGGSTRYSWFSRHWGLSNSVETILTDSREVSGSPKSFPSQEQVERQQSKLSAFRSFY